MSLVTRANFAVTSVYIYYVV